MNHSVSTMTGKTKLKLVLLGTQNVGKSSIIDKYIHNKFDETANPTIGVDFLAKNISYKAKNYRLQLWDTAGQERFLSLIPSYLKDAHCALIVFDVTSLASLEQCHLWIKLYNENKAADGFLFLVGNKIDLDYREISKVQGQEKAKSLGVPYVEVSAKTGENVEEMIYSVIDMHIEKASEPILQQKEQSIVQEQLPEEDADSKIQNKNKIEQDKSTQQLKQDTGKGIITQGSFVKEKAVPRVVIKNQPVEQKRVKKGCC